MLAALEVGHLAGHTSGALMASRWDHCVSGCTFLQAAVYLSRGGSQEKRDSQVILHTPSRRLARSIVTFGSEDGLAFGLRAVRAMEVAADG